MAKQTLENQESYLDHRNKLNSNFNELYDSTASTVVMVNSVDDFPLAVGNVITLPDDNVTYQIDGIVDIGVNRIEVTGEGVQIVATNPYRSALTSTTTGAFVTCNKAITLSGVSFVSFGSHGFTGSDASTDSVIILQCSFVGQTVGVNASNFLNFFVSQSSFENNTDAIKVSGNITNAGIEGCSFNNVTGKLIDLDGCLSKAWNIMSNVGALTASSTFLTLQPNSGNILSGGTGTITGNKIDNSLNGVITSGYSPFDSGWVVLGNSSITDSDRVSPNGWGFYVDDESSSISVTDSPTELTINAVDTQSNSDYLPEAYKVSNLELWSTASNRITPSVVGDSFIARVQITLDSTSGNPKSLNCQLDIGNGVTPTIVIAVGSTALRSSSFPQPYTFVFPIFSLNTFVTNGGKFYLQTDTGTATVGFRSILIERTSTGAR